MRVTIKDNSAIFKAAKERALEAILTAIGGEAVGNAVEELTNLDAIDTGRLRNSITYATEQYTEPKDFTWDRGVKSGAPAGAGVTEPMGTPEKGSVYIGTNVEYAKEIEAGTSKRLARPYLKPAMSDHGEEYRRIAENILKNVPS